MKVENPEWLSVVNAVLRSEQQGFAVLYDKFSSFRSYFSRQVGAAHSDDLYHQLILDLVDQIRRGQLREPERLPGYVRTIAKRNASDAIRGVVCRRHTEQDLVLAGSIACSRPGPEAEVIRQQEMEIARRVLETLSRRDREVLVRFYVKEQPPEHIQRELGLTGTQYRLAKSRAKARFIVLCRARFECQSPAAGCGSAQRAPGSSHTNPPPAPSSAAPLGTSCLPRAC
jgi:RNA polymerase sigma-70 factor (ECF subfamily)